MRFSKTVLIMLLTFLIASCGLIKIAYNNSPALAFWWLDDYFNFNNTQQTILKPALQRLHNWHRADQLPVYIGLLTSIQNSLAKEQITDIEACEKLNAIKQSAYTLQIESVPIIVEIAPLLSDAQLKQFQAKLDERAKKWKKEWWQETKKDQLEARYEKTQDFAEKMYGDLNNGQISLLKQSLTKAAISPEVSYAEIERRNEDALTILKALQNQALTNNEETQLVKAGFDRMQKSPNLAYQSYADKLMAQTCETIANLHNTTDSKQRLHAKNWLQNYVDQATALQIK